MRVVTRCQSLILLLIVLLFMSTMSKAEGLTVAAANSTCDVMKKIGSLYRQQQGFSIELICKSSGRLAKGIVGRAITADIFISANKRWMDYMIEGKSVAVDSVVTPWGNSLVIAVPVNSSLVFEKWSDLQSSDIRVVMIGDPGTAPFGRYAKQAMQTTGIWGGVRDKIQTKKHITLLAETLADTDVNTVGILFRTNVGKDLKVVYALDESWHKPIRYYMAPISTTEKKSLADSFLGFLRSSQVNDLVESSGFVVIN
jgi:molybdate transport system substrate-binding protein